MLAADKLQLQSALKQQATALKEKEFNLHQSNLMTIGTQAAVLAGLDITMFVEFQPPKDHEWSISEVIPRSLKFFYYITIVTAFCANISVVAKTTTLSVLGAGLALRGPDGSMMTATDGLYEERTSVYKEFAIGLGATVSSVVLCVWLILSPEAALVCSCVTIYFLRQIVLQYYRIHDRFAFDESQTVDFTDIFEGPAAIQTISAHRRGGGGRGGSSHHHHQYPNDMLLHQKYLRHTHSADDAAAVANTTGGDTDALRNGPGTAARRRVGNESSDAEMKSALLSTATSSIHQMTIA